MPSSAAWQNGQSMTTEAPVTPPPRRRWKRWVVVGLLIAAMIRTWAWFTEHSLLQSASLVKLGQTEEDVRAIMGPETSRYSTMYFAAMSRTSGYLYGLSTHFRSSLSTAMRKAGFQPRFPDLDDYSVHIRFDINGRVDRIKRGNEIIEAPPEAEAVEPYWKTMPTDHPSGLDIPFPSTTPDTDRLGADA
jgi:hypothetical protein